jgi:hypothetical protein
MDRFASRDQVRRFILSRAVRRYAEAGPPGGYGTVEHNGKVYGTDPTLVDLIGRVAGDFDETPGARSWPSGSAGTAASGTVTEPTARSGRRG